jgi:hypothetical protein
VVKFNEEANIITVVDAPHSSSISGTVYIIGVASHVTPGLVSKPTVTTVSWPFVRCKCSNTYHYTSCY